MKSLLYLFIRLTLEKMYRKTWQVTALIVLYPKNLSMGPCINDVNHLGGRGDLPKGDVTPQAYLFYKSILIKVSDKGEGGVKSLKKWVTLFMDGPNK